MHELKQIHCFPHHFLCIPLVLHHWNRPCIETNICCSVLLIGIVTERKYHQCNQSYKHHSLQ